jgi:hypothetical protein
MPAPYNRLAWAAWPMSETPEEQIFSARPSAHTAQDDVLDFGDWGYHERMGWGLPS